MQHGSTAARHGGTSPIQGFGSFGIFWLFPTGCLVLASDLDITTVLGAKGSWDQCGAWFMFPKATGKRGGWLFLALQRSNINRLPTESGSQHTVRAVP